MAIEIKEYIGEGNIKKVKDEKKIPKGKTTRNKLKKNRATKQA